MFIYDHFIIGSHKPTYVNTKYDDNIYPNTFHLFKKWGPSNNMIPESCKISNDEIKITEDYDFNKNKFIASIVFLQKDDILKYIDSQTEETIDNAIKQIISLSTYFHYSINYKVHLEILDILLNKLQSMSDNFYGYMDKYSEIIEISNKTFGGVIYNSSYHPHVFENIEYVTDANDMFTVIQNYEADLPTVCKYCLCSTPKEQLVRHLCKHELW